VEYSKEKIVEAETQIKNLEEAARQLRADVIKIYGRYGSGHIGGSLSVIEIISALYFNEMKYDPRNTFWEDRDRFILSKGHGCFAQYAALAKLGVLSQDDLKHPYKIDGPMQGHPEFGITPGVEVSTGALGQGLSVGIGMAVGARIQNKSFRVYVVLGDGELNEGQVWEAFMLAPRYKLDNLVAFVDQNRFSLTDSTEVVLPSGPLDKKLDAFGWHVISVDGHSIREIFYALQTAKKIKEKPTVIIAHTIKGKGVESIQNTAVSHSTNLPREDAVKALKELGLSDEEIEEGLKK